MHIQRRSKKNNSSQQRERERGGKMHLRACRVTQFCVFGFHSCASSSSSSDEVDCWASGLSCHVCATLRQCYVARSLPAWRCSDFLGRLPLSLSSCCCSYTAVCQPEHFNFTDELRLFIYQYCCMCTFLNFQRTWETWRAALWTMRRESRILYFSSESINGCMRECVCVYNSFFI